MPRAERAVKHWFICPEKAAIISGAGISLGLHTPLRRDLKLVKSFLKLCVARG